MDAMIQQQLKIHWEGKEEVEAYPLSKTITLSFACRFIMGIDKPERIARLANHFDNITLGMHSTISSLPRTTFYLANKAADANPEGAFVCDKGEERGDGNWNKDARHILIVATDPSGKFMPEAEIADKGIYWTGSTVNMNPKYFLDPEKFDPSRYGEGNVLPPPYTYVPYQW